MAGPIYKVWLMKYKEPWYKLTIEEQNKLMAQGGEALKQAGGDEIIMCASMWSSEKWLGWGVEKFPDIDAVQKHSEKLFSLNWFEYIDSVSYLGVEMPQPGSEG
jgi:hypothetical protein